MSLSVVWSGGILPVISASLRAPQANRRGGSKDSFAAINRVRRERERDADGVDRDPAPAPLLGDVCGRAGPACRVQHEVAGIACHQHAALTRFPRSSARRRPDPLRRRVRPTSSEMLVRKVVEVTEVIQPLRRDQQATRSQRAVSFPRLSVLLRVVCRQQAVPLAAT